MFYWIILVIIIVIILACFVLPKQDKETHIHPKPIFDQTTNQLKIRLSPHVKHYTISRVISAHSTNSKSNIVTKGPNMNGEITDDLVTFDHDGSTGNKTIQLDPSLNIEPNQLKVIQVTNNSLIDTTSVTSSTLGGCRTYTFVIDPSIKESLPTIQQTGGKFFDIEYGSTVKICSTNNVESNSICLVYHDPSKCSSDPSCGASIMKCFNSTFGNCTTEDTIYACPIRGDIPDNNFNCYVSTNPVYNGAIGSTTAGLMFILTKPGLRGTVTITIDGSNPIDCNKIITSTTPNPNPTTTSCSCPQ